MNTVASSFASLNAGLAYPEMFLLAASCVLLVGDLFMPAHGRDTRLTLAGVVIFAITAVLVITGNQPQNAGLMLSAKALAPQYAFSNMFVVDGMSTLLKVAMLLSMAVVLIYSRAYMVARNIFTTEFVALLLFATLGMMLMVSANNFVPLYLGLELLALSSYALVAINRDSAVSTEAAMKYFILGALASGLLLYGMSMIYGATGGSLDIDRIAKTIAYSQAKDPLVSFGVVFIIAGLAFKLGVVPFHMWVPDVYHGAPTPVTLFIGSAPKIAAFGFVIRIVADGLGGASGDWQGMLVILAVLSIGLGNLVAIAQTNLKRMLAYSTISHMGFLLLGILAASREGYAASMFYVITYAITALASFGVILLLSRTGFEADELVDLKGLNKRSPWVAFLMLIVAVSLAGIPLTAGFFAKLAVLEAALKAGFLWVVVFAVLMSVIGAFYYLRIIKLMYFDEPTDNHPIEGTSGMHALLSVNALTILVFGLFPGALISACMAAINRTL